MITTSRMGRVSQFLFNDLLNFNLRGLNMEQWKARRDGWASWRYQDSTDAYTTDLCTVGQEFLKALWRRSSILLLLVLIFVVTPVNIIVGGISAFQIDWNSTQEVFNAFASGFYWAAPPIPEGEVVGGWETIHRMFMAVVYVVIPAGVTFLAAFFGSAFLVVHAIALFDRPIAKQVSAYKKAHPKTDEQPSVWSAWIQSFRNKTCVPIRVDHEVVAVKDVDLEKGQNKR